MYTLNTQAIAQVSGGQNYTSFWEFLVEAFFNATQNNHYGYNQTTTTRTTYGMPYSVTYTNNSNMTGNMSVNASCGFNTSNVSYC